MKFLVATKDGRYLGSSMKVVGRYYFSSDITEDTLMSYSVSDAREACDTAKEMMFSDDFPAKTSIVGMEDGTMYQIKAIKPTKPTIR